MLRKILLVVAFAATVLSLQVKAEEARAMLTTENKFPELSRLELSYLLEDMGYDGFDYQSHSALLRYGLIENLTARLQVPYVQRDPDFGTSTDGLGDIKLGFDLLAYEDIFRYPYVIPHADMSFSTGEEDDGLGSGKTSYSFGVSVGTVVYEVLHYVVDATYVVDADTRTGVTDDAMMGSLSIIWDISKRFSVMGEGRVLDYQDANTTSAMLGGGLTYAWTENLGSTLFIAGWPDTAYGEDQTTMLKVSYSF
jgi:hypothetical protein